ncbi:MAG: hypothetical protein FWC01_03295 [Treponema sp.]|nr:hypothetical protein [Treponema sp.]MCL2237048.1 hypothetical protein [Treponema sp.]
MAKTGKILAAIIIYGLFFCVQTFAQGPELNKADLQSIYVAHLQREGFLPTVDTDGDIQFKVGGVNYFIIIDENDIQFFQIYMGFNLGSFEVEDAMQAANIANRRSKVAKVTVSPERMVVSITIEILLNTPTEFAPIFARSLSLIRNAENIFRDNIREISSARE